MTLPPPPHLKNARSIVEERGNAKQIFYTGTRRKIEERRHAGREGFSETHAQLCCYVWFTILLFTIFAVSVTDDCAASWFCGQDAGEEGTLPRNFHHPILETCFICFM